jgi:hypothetical protein
MVAAAAAVVVVEAYSQPMKGIIHSDRFPTLRGCKERI